MKYLGIIEKFMILFGLMKKYYVILILLGIFVLTFLLKLFKKISKKKMLIINFMSFLLSVVFIIMLNYKILSKTFDNFFDILFANVYFPSIYVYLFVLISSYIVVIFSIISKRLSKGYKRVNYVMSLSLNIILLLILNIIANDKIDIFSNDSLYTNVGLVSMLELSINIYVLWLIVVFAIYLINNITQGIIDKKVKKNSLNISDNVVEEVNSSYSKDNNKRRLLSYEMPSIISNNGEPKFINLSVIDKIRNQNYNDIVFETSVAEPNVVENIKNKSFISEVESNVVGSAKVEPFIDEAKVNFLNQVLTNSLPLENSINYVDNVNNNQLIEKENVTFNPVVEDIAVDKQLMNKVEKNIIKIDNSKFTLENYKLFSRMLKETMRINNKNTIKIDDMYNLDLLNKFSYEEYSLFKKMLKSFIN